MRLQEAKSKARKPYIPPKIHAVVYQISQIEVQLQAIIMIAIEKLQASQSLTALAYERIKRYVLEGALDEDTCLTEDFLSKQLGISKSPVREALNSLHIQGLVRIEPRRGTYLRQFSVKEVRDLYDLREALEVFAVATAEMTPAILAELSRSLELTHILLEEHDRARYIEEDVRFHSVIAGATGNAELCRVLQNVHDQIWLCRCKTYHLSSGAAFEAHRAVFDALAKGDRKRAKSAMRDHISHVRKSLIAFLEARSAAPRADKSVE
jgi:DNA-binding GntR family transcriptional regulator